MPTTKPPSDTQRCVLLSAADRHDRGVLPLPETVTLRGAVRQRVLQGLLQAGLVEEVPSDEPQTTWHTDERGNAVALRITAGGLATIGRSDASPQRSAKRRVRRPAEPGDARNQGGLPAPVPAAVEAVASGENGDAPVATPPAARPGSKLAIILAALSADSGATLDELVAITGWLPHTTRAALTRLRQSGHSLLRTEQNGRKAYRIIGAAG